MNFPLPSKFLIGVIKDRGANEKVKKQLLTCIHGRWASQVAQW